MIKVNHNKIKNSGILFELLTRQITADVLLNKESPAINIIKKHFIKSELGKEYKLYETLFKQKQISEGKADIVISTILELSKKLNRSELNKAKYNLIKEIKEHYDLNDFFKVKIPNYKYYAAFYNLMEIINNNINNPEEIILNKITILEHLINKKVEDKKDELIEEFNKYDKDVRILSYKIISDKFNKKYSNLNENQKLILKEYINSVDNTLKLREFYNLKIGEVKSSLLEINKKTKNEASKIKINEVLKLIQPIHSSNKVKDENIVDLMQYCELLEELKNANG